MTRNSIFDSHDLISASVFHVVVDILFNGDLGVFLERESTVICACESLRIFATPRTANFQELAIYLNANWLTEDILDSIAFRSNFKLQYVLSSMPLDYVSGYHRFQSIAEFVKFLECIGACVVFVSATKTYTRGENVKLDNSGARVTQLRKWCKSFRTNSSLEVNVEPKNKVSISMLSIMNNTF